MTVRYAYNDADGAPQLYGYAGSLVSVLDAVLVDGYGNHSPQGWSIINNSLTQDGINQTTGNATGGSATSCIDTTKDFLVSGVIVGMKVTKVSGGASAIITSITTTTNPNDTLNYASGPTFGGGDAYTVQSHRRIYKQPAGTNGMCLRVEDTGMGLIASTYFSYFHGFESLTGFVTGKATGGGATSLIDTTKNFVTAGVIVGNIVRRFVAGSITNAVITSITTTTNPNDTLNYTSGTNTPTFASGEAYCVDLGINVFPTTAQLNGWSYPLGGAHLMKYQSQGATAGYWWVFGNGKIFHFVIDAYRSNQYNNAITFGDIYSFKYGADPYCTIIKGGNGVSYPSNWPYLVANLTSLVTGQAMARSQTGSGAAIGCAWTSDYIKTGGQPSNLIGNGGLGYPHGPDGSIVLAPIWVSEGTVALGIRGILPGVWNPCHAKGILNTGDTFGGLASLPGRTFEYFNNMGTSGSCVFETSPTW